MTKPQRLPSKAALALAFAPLLPPQGPAHGGSPPILQDCQYATQETKKSDGGTSITLATFPVYISNRQSDLFEHAIDIQESAYAEHKKGWWKLLRADPIAAFTGVLAIFTIGLFGTSAAQWCIISRQLKLARDEFIASHRPRIILRDVSLIEEGGSYEILYMLVNNGESEATVVESWVIAEVVPHGHAIRNMRSAGHDDLGKLVIAAGEMKDLTYVPEAPVGRYFRLGPNAFRLAEEHKGGAPTLYFTGAILYSDQAESRRRSVFRRRWDQGRKGFYRTDDPDHEYAD